MRTNDTCAATGGREVRARETHEAKIPNYQQKQNLQKAKARAAPWQEHALRRPLSTKGNPVKQTCKRVTQAAIPNHVERLAHGTSRVCQFPCLRADAVRRSPGPVNDMGLWLGRRADAQHCLQSNRLAASAVRAQLYSPLIRITVHVPAWSAQPHEVSDPGQPPLRTCSRRASSRQRPG